MSGYLVVLITAFDTRPVRLFDSRGEAVAFAEAATVGDEDASRRGMKRGCLIDRDGCLRLSEAVLAVGVLPFDGGEPGELIPVRSFAGAGRPQP